MLKYETIYEVSGARRRLKGQDRYSYRYDGRTRDNDQLALFTFENEALHDSQHNLDWLLELARSMDQRYVVLTDNKVQIAGECQGRSEILARAMAPESWCKRFDQWVDAAHTRATSDETSRGGAASLHLWRRCLVLKEHQGVYETATGRKITNREEIIRAFWDLGFATWRGRPYSIAKLRWSGEREELEELTELNNRYWYNSRKTEVAKKIVSAYRSINRYAAWPGAW